MEKECLEKLYVYLAKHRTPKIISSVRGDRIEKMIYEDGNWVDCKKSICRNKNPCDDRTRYHYVKLISRPNGEIKVYECGICGKDFPFRYSLLRHIPVHTGARNFVCPICQKTFRQQSTLWQHSATHLTLKPYKCSVCSKTFNRTSTLAAHRRTHSNEKIYKCQFCGNGFNQKINLEAHINTHTGARPFQCDICFRRFNQKSNLDCHKKSVHFRNAQITQVKTLSTIQMPLLTVKAQKGNPLIQDTIVTIIKNPPPKKVMDKLLKNQPAFVLFIENDFISPTSITLKAIVIDDNEFALVRIQSSDNRLANVSWTVLRETTNKGNIKMFGYDNAFTRYPLIFCDDSYGVNIQQYIKNRSKLLENGQQLKRVKVGCQVDEELEIFDGIMESLEGINFDEIEDVTENYEVPLSEGSNKACNDRKGTTDDSDEIDFSWLLNDDDVPISRIAEV